MDTILDMLNKEAGYHISTLFSDETKERFEELYKLVIQSASGQGEAKVWANMPSYYVNDRFVRVIPFKDHINIEASAITKYANELKDYKITPKGMLQIYSDQIIPVELLGKIIAESLLSY